MYERPLRFVGMLPPEKQESPFIIRLAFNTEPTAFIPELRRLINVAQAHPANIYAFIRAWLDKSSAASPETIVPFHSQFVSFSDALNRNKFLSFEEVQEIIGDTFGQPAEELVTNASFFNLRNNLGEIIVGLTNILDYKQGLLEEYSDPYRLQEIIRRVATNDQSLAGRRIRAFLRSIIEIPEDLIVSRMSRDGGMTEAPLPENESEEKENNSRLEKLKELNKSIEEHRWAINELKSLGPHDFRLLSDGSATITTTTTSQPADGNDDDTFEADAVRERPVGGHAEENNTASNVSGLRRRSTIATIAPSSVSRLSGSTRQVIQSLEIDPITTSHEEVVDRIT